MHPLADDVVSRLPAEPKESLLPMIRETFLKSGKTLVVLDDDPTGTQTCYDAVVLTSWTVPLLVEELSKEPSVLFILTNSRSTSGANACAMAGEIGANLLRAEELSGRKIAVISRSDSTLRGHFPAEVDAVAEALDIGHAVRILIPAFVEGGRLTIDDVHYIREEGRLVPVAETPFARDTLFGYRHSNLREWVEEKTEGRTKASEVVSVSLEDIRIGGPDAVSVKLMACAPGHVCVVNAVSHRDLETVVAAVLKAEEKGQTFIYRTSATFVPLRAGLPAGRIIAPAPEDMPSGPSLVIVGSYVPKTTRQLATLLREASLYSVEVRVPDVIGPARNDAYSGTLSAEADKALRAGKDVIIYTSRDLATGKDAESTLQIHSKVSGFLVDVMKGLTTRPSFIIAKGGITSSDLATKALHAEKAFIAGQVIPGVPVWKLGEGTRFPGMYYVVFPGNVGDDDALAEVWRKLSRRTAGPQSKPKT